MRSGSANGKPSAHLGRCLTIRATLTRLKFLLPSLLLSDASSVRPWEGFGSGRWSGSGCSPTSTCKSGRHEGQIPEGTGYRDQLQLLGCLSCPVVWLWELTHTHTLPMVRFWKVSKTWGQLPPELRCSAWLLCSSLLSPQRNHHHSRSEGAALHCLSYASLGASLQLLLGLLVILLYQARHFPLGPSRAVCLLVNFQYPQ